MRVTIDHQTTKRGFLFKKTYHQVSLTMALSHEEKQIIRQRGLRDTKLLDRRPANAKVDQRDVKFELRMRDVMDGRTDHFLCATPSQAKIYEDNLLVMLAQVKRWLDDNADTADRIVVEL